ncbi:MAG: carbamoyltransferase HypF [Candidatus Contendobacter sp.]|jgi:hydrogenase maturation protein HypF|nr:carbamoyltransferase HypF [Gammaproteobacteria bacterium]MCC8993033.1 carbamoyltransferase HypF [Candidatus Contendobacter sp.]
MLHQRRAIRIRGQVQGVGFRPFIYRLAIQRGLSGWVRNDGAGVDIEIQGDAATLDDFLDALRDLPPLARIDSLQASELPALALEPAFTIAASSSDSVSADITPDTAICRHCLAELFDPQDRRYRYPFISCTDCGPRYTITAALPYDRPNTSMAGFPLCPGCAQEYRDPGDRRFHAQPNACPVCGPRLTLRDAQGVALAAADVVTAALEGLQTGAILAIKGLGGFHLVCDAQNPAAVERLRQCKQRDAKPFAVMAANVASLTPWVEGDPEEWRLLESPQRPIVLLRRRLDSPRPPGERPGVREDRLPGIAPGLAHLGVLLPYTPLHYLLFHEAAGRPDGTAWLEQPQPLLLVMTSANPGGEPLVIDDDEAVRRLTGIADGFVTHDRAILARCDDSVIAGGTFIRRARGYTPQSIQLPSAGPSVLALGGYLKNTICLTRDDRAYLAPHIGTLDNAQTCLALEEAVHHLQQILRIAPERIACDRHPDFPSSRLAAAIANERSLPCIAVQHHHAHIAAVMAEHGLREPVLGLALDGVGLGADGGIWGGELLRVDGADFIRLGHLRPLPLPGGDRAACEPWRLAAAALHLLGRDAELTNRFGSKSALIRQMLEQRLNTPETSSAGRLFDAAAGLLGVREICAYEGQAAMELEALAHRHGPTAALVDGFRLSDAGVLDLLPTLAWLADGVEPAAGAAVFHATLAAGLSAWLAWAGERSGIRQVAFGGGCFLNQLLSSQLQMRLKATGWRVFTARLAPPNDGGLSLGQAWAAMQD